MISDALSKFAQWLLDALLWVPLKIWELILDGLASVIESMPVPDFVSTASNAFGSIPSNVLFFANFFALGEGIAMILAAYGIRFLIRRIPLIG